MHEGYIKLHRCALGSIWAKQPDFMAVWVYCLLRANYKAADVITEWGGMIHLEPGQFITSRLKISEQTGVQESKVERILNIFKSEQQIEQQNRGKFRVITVCNWSKYQIDEQQNEQQVNNRRTTSEQQVNTNKKEERMIKKIKKESKGMFPLCQAWNDYLEMRIKIKKPLTDGAKGMAVKKLIVLQALGHDPVEVLNQSTFNSWQGLFEVKGKENGTCNFGGSKATGGKAPSAVSSAGSGKNGTSGLFAGDFPDKSDQW